MRLFRVFINKIKNMIIADTITKKIVRYYFLAVFVGGFILFLPISLRPGITLLPIDALFTAMTSFSDTGLTVVNTKETFSFFGKLVILALLQLGGIGIIAIKILILMALGKRIGVTERLMFQSEQGQSGSAGVVKLIKSVISIIMVSQFVAIILLTIRMVVHYNYTLTSAIWFAYFHAVSAINNAGIDNTGDSLVPFVDDYFIQYVIIALIIIGGIGFPVLYDLKKGIQKRLKKESYRYSIITKFTLVSYFGLLILGFILVMFVERNNILVDHGLIGGAQRILFHVVSTRNAGFATMDLNYFTSSTKMIFIFLMWVGAGPASTGGGIRITTFALAILYVFSFAIGREDVEVFKRRIKKSTIERTMIIIFMSIALVFTGTFILMDQFGASKMMDVLFEVSSAFGTTGLSLGVTPDLNTTNKIIIILIMFVGQASISATLLIWADRKQNKKGIKYPEQDISIG